MKPPYFIAEIGLNHQGNFRVAREMIYQAAEAGADAVKFQAAWADTLCAKDSPTYFQQVGEAAQTQWEFFKRSDALTRKDYEQLAAYAYAKAIDFGITCFQPEDVAWADPLVKWHKIASADINNWALLDAIAATGKPVYLSTGAATTREVREAADHIGWRRVTLLHCVLAYPTPRTDARLERIRDIMQGWPWVSWVQGGPTPAGYSCHVPFDVEVLTTAWLLGASVIEKHFTLDKSQAGNDHYHSMDPDDLRCFRARVAELLPLLGDGDRSVVPDHENAARLHARRSWAARRDLDVGRVLAEPDLIALRPGTGIPVSESIIGRIVDAPIPAGHLIPPAALRPAALFPILSP